MKVYKIECEWDMGFKELYATKEEAQKDIEEVEWELECGDSLESLITDGYVSIKEIKL